ncbi:IS5 family transposase [Pseudobacteriovorax antillogorgiicola]|uniref:IS5 family transposase n=1 Tax=Pseudobacteriovorax antillogorgiicola TaxID=1513793 RepID=UPI00135634DE|nr:IS5 family transposase [Pseudobacteriovorax antillogorgiicola]
MSDPSPKGGRPRRKNLRDIADGIFYKLRTGCQWKAVPRCFGPPSTIHDYFTRWVEQGVFEKLWELALKEYDELQGISWKHQSVDVAIVKSPLAGKKTGPNPTDRRKLGSKRSVLVDELGVPLSCVIAPANVHDSKSFQETLKSRKFRRRRNRCRKTMHLHADKGYSSKKCRETCRRHGYIPVIPNKKRRDRRGRPLIKKDKKRWVAEASFGWQNQCRNIKTRWDKKASHYQAQLHIAFAHIAFAKSGVFG